ADRPWLHADQLSLSRQGISVGRRDADAEPQCRLRGPLFEAAPPARRQLDDGRRALSRRAEQRPRPEALRMPRDDEYGRHRLRKLDAAGAKLLLRVNPIPAN